MLPSFQKLIFLGLVSLILLPSPLRADDIKDAIEEARTAYDKGDLSSAKSALDTASQLIAQINASGLGKFLPNPPTGWTAGNTETDASAAAMFGGGLIAKRQYTSGDKTVQVQIIANSPILMQVSAMFGNAQMLGAMGKVFRNKGKTAVLTKDGDIQMLVGKTYLTIDGSGSETDKRLFLDLIDLAALENFKS